MLKYKYDLSSQFFFNNVHSTFSKMRKECPVYNNESCFYITKFQDCKEILKSNSITKNAIAVLAEEDKTIYGEIHENIQYILGTLILSDGHQHKKLRNAIKNNFSQAALSKYPDFFEQKSLEVLNTINQNQVDLIDSYIEPFIVKVLIEFFGINYNSCFISFFYDFKIFQRKIFPLVASKEIFSFIKNNHYSIKIINFFKKLCEEEGSITENGYIFQLKKMEKLGILTHKEIISLSLITFGAFYESSMALIPNSVLTFLNNLEEFDLLKRQPNLMDSAIQECIRYVTPLIFGTERWLTQDIVLSNCLIPKGSQIVLALKSANRDEDIFENPDKFSITRYPNNHLSFGLGMHFCLGNHIAKLMLERVLQDLIAHFPHISISVDFNTLEWHPSEFTSLKSLPVKFK